MKEEEEQRDFEAWLTNMAAIVCSAMECGEGPVFDEQIYKSRSLRLVGASRPGGGSRLVPRTSPTATSATPAPAPTTTMSSLPKRPDCTICPLPEEAAANGARVVVVSATLRRALQDAMTAYAVEEEEKEKDDEEEDGDGLSSLWRRPP